MTCAKVANTCFLPGLKSRWARRTPRCSTMETSALFPPLGEQPARKCFLQLDLHMSSASPTRSSPHDRSSGCIRDLLTYT